MSRYAVGRAVQFVGLLVLPFAIASELVGAVGLGRSMLIALLGVVVFYLGRAVQGAGP